MAVHKCPVCNGMGTVAPGFYDPGELDTTAPTRPSCRSCGGKGVIITPEPRYYPPWRPEPCPPRYYPATNEPPNPCERWYGYYV